MTIRERYHVAAGELCGRLAGKLLKRLALHALAIDDDLTFYRVKDVLALGVRQGWHPDDPTRHVRPNRGRRGAGAREWPEPVLGRSERGLAAARHDERYSGDAPCPAHPECTKTVREHPQDPDYPWPTFVLLCDGTHAKV